MTNWNTNDFHFKFVNLHIATMFQDRVYVEDLVFILTRQKKKVTVGCKSKTSLKKKRLRSNSAFNFWGSEREREGERYGEWKRAWERLMWSIERESERDCSKDIHVTVTQAFWSNLGCFLPLVAERCFIMPLAYATLISWFDKDGIFAHKHEQKRRGQFHKLLPQSFITR